MQHRTCGCCSGTWILGENCNSTKQSYSNTTSNFSNNECLNKRGKIESMAVKVSDTVGIQEVKLLMTVVSKG